MAVQPLAAQDAAWRRPVQALGVSRATFYRRQRSTPGHRSAPSNARPGCCVKPSASRILDVLAGPPLRRPCAGGGRGDAARRRPLPRRSERTMYRILAADQPVRERRNQLRASTGSTPSPSLVATAPNQTWSWDITKLLGPTKWTYFYLYVVLDIFSRLRRSAGWSADRENSALAGRLIEESPATNRASSPRCSPCTPDRGAPMTSKCTARTAPPTSA